MSYTEVTGDLFDLDLPAIGHGVNCQGLMGAGVAKVMRAKYPAMFLAYQRRCRLGRLHPGEIMVWPLGLFAGNGPVIYNLATQDQPGADATLPAVRQSVRAMLEDAEHRGLSAVGIPRIGAGIGGLAWEDVRSVLLDETEHAPVALIVVSLPGAGA